MRARVLPGAEGFCVPMGVVGSWLMMSSWLLIAWGMEWARVVFVGIGVPLEGFGVRPREWEGLFGVLLTPWVHQDWAHLWGNSAAFVGLGIFMALAAGKRLLGTCFLLLFWSGLGTWLI
ncbi:MAG: hypothetical protein AAGC74_03495, partial [Verrucomicrobiota bacterium]